MKRKLERCIVIETSGCAARWMLKQVQHDEDRERMVYGREIRKYFARSHEGTKRVAKPVRPELVEGLLSILAEFG